MTMQTTESGTSPKTWAIIVWALMLAGYVTAITAIIGVIIAYLKRGELAATPFASHMTSAIRTFWIGLIGAIIGVVLSFIGVGLIILGLVVIWQLFRIIRGLVRALDGRPIENPDGWL